MGIRVVTGASIELLDEEFELIVKNPGIPYTNPLVAEALTRKIPIITEVELAGQLPNVQLSALRAPMAKQPRPR